MQAWPRGAELQAHCGAEQNFMGWRKGLAVSFLPSFALVVMGLEKDCAKGSLEIILGIQSFLGPERAEPWLAVQPSHGEGQIEERKWCKEAYYILLPTSSACRGVLLALSVSGRFT